MNIKILGSGCAKCAKLKLIVEEAVKNLKLDAAVEKVEDFMIIMEYGVMITPALVIDEKVIFSGKVPSVKEIEGMLNDCKKV